VLPDSPQLAAMLAAEPDLRDVLADAPRYRLQVVLGLVDESAPGHPRLVQHGFRAGAEYLYPASTVKLFAAVAALERLAELRAATGLPIDARSRLAVHPLFPGETLEDADPTNLDGGTITVEQEVRRIFLVSDNQAFNRLYELVGPDRLEAMVDRAGLAGVHIVHRLSEPHTAEENLRLPRVDITGDGFVHTEPARTSSPLHRPFPVAGLAVGEAWLDGDGTRHDGPMDFSGKNRAPLASLQKALCMAVRPEVDCGGVGFTLSGTDRDLLRQAMGELPRESRSPRLAPEELADDYVKFMLPGLRRVVAPNRLRVYDKSGQAYGFTLDNAWVVDTVTGRSFFLAAGIYTNADGVLNDDRYEDATVGQPALAAIAEAVARALWGR
jgi:hypothetical protein